MSHLSTSEGGDASEGTGTTVGLIDDFPGDEYAPPPAEGSSAAPPQPLVDASLLVGVDPPPSVAVETPAGRRPLLRRKTSSADLSEE